MATFLEILKYIIPSLVVFATCYFLIKQFFNKEYALKALELKGKYSKDAIPLKLQAYERLLLFCDRISIPNLLLRLKTRNMTVDDLKAAMMISVQKEFEHNMAQQLYVSNKLWEILHLAKNDTISLITSSAEGLSNQENAESLANKLMQKYSSMQKNPIQIATTAIKEEAKIILDV